MLAVLLMILKIIGIVLLSILALLLAIILIVLFVPVRYRIDVNKPSDDANIFMVRARISYLLRIFRINVTYPKDEKIAVYALFFKLYPRKQRVKKTSSKKTNKNDTSESDVIKNQEKESEEIKSDILKDAAKEEVFDNTINQLEVSANEVIEDNIKDFDEKKSISDFIHKLFNIIRNLKLTLLTLYAKINDVVNNVSYYIDIVNSREFKNAFALAKRSLKRLFRCVRPRRLKGYVRFGTDDPSVSAEVFGLYSLIYPYMDKHFTFIPELEGACFNGDVTIKGHIRVFNILIIAIGVYFNKDIKKLIKLFKKEK